MADTFIFNLVDTAQNKYTAELDKHLPSGALGDLSLLTKAFYDVYDDEYDFIFFLRVCPKANAWNAQLYDVNKTKCLGLGIGSWPDYSWDLRSYCGSKGRLAAAVSVPLVMEPSDPPHIHRALIQHWGVKFAGLTRFPLITVYGWLYNSANGVAGGFNKATLRDLNNKPILDPLSINADTYFRVTTFDLETSPVSRTFAPIELWMMGLAAKEEVEDLYFMKQPLSRSTVGDTMTIKCGGFGRLTADEIITNNFGGPPKAASSSFRSAWVLVSETPAAPEVLAKAELYAKLCGGVVTDSPPSGQARWISFTEATRGRATMDTRLGATLAPLPIQVHPNNRMVTVTVPQDVFDGWCTKSYNTDYQQSSKLARQLYARFKDDFDFIAFVLDLDNKPDLDTVPFGQYSPVANSIQGIGKLPRNDSALFGSTGRLKGYFTLWSRTAMENGPFLHELCHNWANSAIPTEGFQYDATIKEVKAVSYGKDAGGHWGYSGCGGQLGGFDQATLKSGVDNTPNKYQASIAGYMTFGQNANWGNCVPYSNFELYLMGLIPASELKPFDVFSGLKYDSDGAANGKFYADKKTTYDQQSLTALLGPRVPDYKDAQKEFRILIAVLTPAPALKPADATVIDEMLARQSTAGDDGRYTFNFYEATGGRGRLSFDLSQSKR